MSAPVLTKEHVAAIHAEELRCMGYDVVKLAESHEALRAERDELAAKLEFVVAPIEAGGGYAAQMRAERDAALAEVARLKASIMVWYDQLTTRDLGAIQGEMREAVSPTAPITAADIRRAMAAIASDPEVQP